MLINLKETKRIDQNLQYHKFISAPPTAPCI